MKKFLLGCLALAIGFTTAQAQVITVSGEITTNTTWTNNNIYVLNGFVYVEDGATLTIQAGTLIKGDKISKGTLIITKTGMIMAQGTACEPIVFTSNQPAGSRNYGDWGGVIILGEAPINVPGGDALIEGGVDTPEGDGHYGGASPADNSGVFSYCRIEFPGIPFLPDNEINGLTMGGVGSTTQIDHIQVSYSGDDSYEWFGGRVNAKYLIAYRGWDDDFDTDFGYRGKVQFAYALRDPNIADVSGSNGFESDNDGTGTSNQPFTKALFSNVTIAGPKVTTGTTISANYKRGAHVRRNTQCSIFNSIIMGYPEAGYKIEGSNTSDNANNDSLKLRACILSGHADDYVCTSCTAGFDIDVWAGAHGNVTYVNNSSVNLIDAFNLSNPDPRPNVGSPAASGADFSGQLTDPFFTSVSYKGAFSTTDNWTDEPWVNFDCQNTPYTTPHISSNPTINGIVTASSCPNTGAIDITPSGGTGTYTYLWSNGATTQDITGVNPGSYSVTVTSNTCAATSNYTVSDIKIAKPTGLATSGVTSCGATLSWIDNPVAGSYEMRYRIFGGTFTTPINIGDVTSYTFTGLTANTQYQFQIRAKCPTTSEKSAWASKSAITATCGAPASMSAGTITSSSAMISWINPCTATDYTLQYRKAGTKTWTTVSGIVPTSYTITGLLSSTSYQYRVATNCAGTLSSYLPIQIFTTLPMRIAGEVITDEQFVQMNPNPASTNITISFESVSESTIEILDMTGRIVYLQTGIAANQYNTLSVDVSTFEAGIYLLHVYGEGMDVSKKLVVGK